MMQSRKSRLSPIQRHPAGPVSAHSRRHQAWPRAYDGGLPVAPRRQQRYRRAFDGGEQRASEGPRLRRTPSAMQRLRRHPARHAMVGLTIAGSAIPIAMARQNQALRTNPQHERMVNLTAPPQLTDLTVAQAWRGAVQQAAANAPAPAVAPAQAREAAIQRNLERYKSYDVPRPLAESIYDLALQTDIDPDVAFGLVRAESTFKSTATSPVGAIGLTQLMPATARIMRPGTTRDDLRDPQINLRIGFKYLRELIDKYDGNTRLALLAYNRGPGTVDRVLKRGGDPNNGYADMVTKDIPGR